MTDEKLNRIVKRVNDIFINVKAEVIISELLEADFDSDQIVIAPIGTLKRSFRTDLYDLEWKELESGKKLLYVYLAREGIYDALPQGLFHQPSTLNTKNSSSSLIGEVKRGKMEEQAARTFFLPFEQEIYYQRLAIEQQERKMLSNLKENKSKDLFADFWELDDCLDSKQKAILLNILPLTHKIVGDFDLASQCFEMVIGAPVDIRQIEPISKNVSNSDVEKIGKCILGLNMVLGTSTNDGDPAIEIAIGPLNNDQLANFTPGGRGNEVLEFLCNFFIPVELDIKRKIIVDENFFNSQFDEKKETMRLGYNVCLKSNKKSNLKHNLA